MYHQKGKKKTNPKKKQTPHPIHLHCGQDHTAGESLGN